MKGTGRRAPYSCEGQQSLIADVCYAYSVEHPAGVPQKHLKGSGCPDGENARAKFYATFWTAESLEGTPYSSEAAQERVTRTLLISVLES